MMHKLVGAGVGILLLLSAIESRAQSCQISNPDFDVSPFNNSAGKTLALSKIDTTQINVVLIIPGQSLNANSLPTIYIPANRDHIFNINIEDGRAYVAADPLLGTSNGSFPVKPGQGNFASRLADKLIKDGKIKNVYLVPIAIGGSSAKDWADGLLGRGCRSGSRMAEAYRRLAALGITPGLPNTTFAILWGQGEAEQNDMPKEAYLDFLLSIINDSRSAGFTKEQVPWFINIETQTNGKSLPAIQAAQMAIVSRKNNIWPGFHMDQVGLEHRQIDRTHLNDDGGMEYVRGEIAALHEYGMPF